MIIDRILRRAREEFSYGTAWLQNLLSPYKPTTIVTGANERYYHPLTRLLVTLMRHEKQLASGIVTFDLGLNNNQRKSLTRKFPNVDLRQYDLAAEVPWADISVNAGFYAWKPRLIERVFNELRTDVIWLDSSIIVRKPLLRIRRVMQRQGFYATCWPNHTIRCATSAETIQVLRAEQEADLPMIVASAVGFSQSDHRTKPFLQEWARLASDPTVNNPIGENVGTHKGDQSILSILAYRNGLICKSSQCLKERWLDFFIANDRKTMFDPIEESLFN